MDTTVLTILGAAFGVMFATMTTLMFVSIRVQHRDSTQTRTEMRDLIDGNRDLIERSSKDNRDLIERSSKDNRDLIERSSKDNRDLIERSAEKLSGEFAEHKRLTDANHRAVQEQLGDVRDRLGRIEGHLGIGMPPQPDDDEPGGPPRGWGHVSAGT